MNNRGFVSCVKADAKILKYLRRLVGKDKLASYDTLNIEMISDEKYLRKVPQAIGDSRFFVAVLSKNSVNDKRFQRELSYACNRRKNIMLVFRKPFSINGPMSLMLANISNRIYVGYDEYAFEFFAFVHEALKNE